MSMLKVEITNHGAVQEYPCLMKRVLDEAIVLVTDLNDGGYQVTVLTNAVEIGESYTSDLKPDRYKPLPRGYHITITN